MRQKFQTFWVLTWASMCRRMRFLCVSTSCSSSCLAIFSSAIWLATLCWSNSCWRFRLVSSVWINYILVLIVAKIVECQHTTNTVQMKIKMFYLVIHFKNKKGKFSVPALSPGLGSSSRKAPSGQTALSEPPLLPFESPVSSPLLPSNEPLQFLPPAWDTKRWLKRSSDFAY